MSRAGGRSRTWCEGRSLNYEEDVHERVNPLNPIARGEAVRVWSPISGKYIYVDDCYRYHGDLVDRDMKAGDLAEAKGPGYDHAFAQVYGQKAMEDLVRDTKRQLSAADFRGVGLKMYFFAEKDAADLVRKRFKDDAQLSRVIISHMPPRKGSRRAIEAFARGSSGDHAWKHRTN